MLARQAGKPYVTIDCAYDGALHAHAAATVISREYRAQHYTHVPDDELLQSYTAHSPGLSIFTSGKSAIRYARAGENVRSFAPYLVDAKSTLGAGDTFRAGIVYGILREFSDAECVRFASGLASLLCTRLPIADNVPTLSEVEALRQSNCTGQPRRLMTLLTQFRSSLGTSPRAKLTQAGRGSSGRAGRVDVLRLMQTASSIL